MSIVPNPYKLTKPIIEHFLDTAVTRDLQAVMLILPTGRLLQYSLESG